MKHTTPGFVGAAGLCVLAVAVTAQFAGAQSPTPPPASMAPSAPPAATPEQSSYLFGLTFGEQLHSVGITNQLSAEAINRGIQDGLAGKKSTRENQQQIQAYVQKMMADVVGKNKAAAQEFLAANGKEKGVKTTADGLQYKVVTVGDAKAAPITPNDEVTVNYRGKLLDNSEFDSSYARGTPATFKVNGVIKGWQEALVMMKPGAKWELFVPPELGYDTSPRPGIPGGSLLKFEVELLSVKAADAPAAAAPPGPPGKKAVKPAPSAPANQ